jgi:hypothetical protein
MASPNVRKGVVIIVVIIIGDVRPAVHNGRIIAQLFNFPERDGDGGHFNSSTAFLILTKASRNTRRGQAMFIRSKPSPSAPKIYPSSR